MKKINKLIAILLVAVCVLSGFVGKNYGSKNTGVWDRRIVSGKYKRGLSCLCYDGRAILWTAVAV